MRKLRNFMFVLGVVIGGNAFAKKTEKELPVNIIPQPVELSTQTGSWKLTPKADVVCNNGEALAIAELLVKKLNQSTGYDLEAKQSNKGAIKLCLNSEIDSKIGDEGYTLNSTSKGVTICANKPAGLFYGMQTFMQLLPNEIESVSAVEADWEVPLVSIVDYPKLSWRGLMLDVSRNFFTIDEVKAYIDEMVKSKYNTLHWHLTDDNGWRIEIKSYPKLTEVGAWRVERKGAFGTREEPKPGEPATYGGFYTQDDIRDIVKYAQERYVTIVPEIDVPGHSMAAVAAYPELCCTQDTSIKVNPGTKFALWSDDGTFIMYIDNTLDPSSEKVYAFLDNVLTEVASLFPSQYIHVGGDECYMGFWKKDEDCQKLMAELNTDDPLKLSEYFMSRIEKIVNSKGKKMIGWDEILEGDIAPSTAVMNWHGSDKAIKAVKKGRTMVMSPISNCYLDYMQGDPAVEPPVYATLRLKKCYDYNPIPEGVDPQYVLGGQGNLWTERVPDLRHAEYMTYPRAWALAEDFWSPEENKNWDNFCERLESQFERADIAGVKYCTALYDADIKVTSKDGKKWCTILTEAPNIDVYYTIDNGMPDNYSLKYSKPFEIPEGKVTLRVITYRDGAPIGHLITLTPEDIGERVS